MSPESWMQTSWTAGTSSSGSMTIYIDKVTPLKRDIRSVLEEYDMVDSIIGEKILSIMSRHLA